MEYPIFYSIINQIESGLTSKNVKLNTFKTWREDRINATGLEIGIDVSDESNVIKEITINFDWDRFRETYLARELEGLGEHPMLQDENLKSVTASPKIDVELSWNFDVQKLRVDSSGNDAVRPMAQTRSWMKSLSRNVNNLLAEEECTTRWHLQIEGTNEQNELSKVTLISYFQYSLQDIKSLNEILSTVKYRVRQLMIKSNKVCQLSDNTLKNVA